MTDFTGKTAVVLGGCSGIGLATVHLLSAAGATVIAGSRRGVIEQPIANTTAESVDVLQREQLARFFQNIEKNTGKIDFLVNAATGGARAIGPFMEMDLDQFQGSFAKLWGYTNSVQIGGRHVKDSGAITLVSGYPARRFKPGYIAIATVGNAVEGFVRSMAKELAPVRINAVSPGLIDTPMFPHQGAERDDFFKQGISGHIIPRPGKPEEVARGILFTLQNDFVTGTTVDVDGGALLS